MVSTALSVESRIHEVRGVRAMLSTDLAALYGVAPKALVQGVKRNAERFPADFMLHLKSQSVTSRWGGVRRAMPCAFTEQGVAMLSSVLRSPRAVAVNVEIMRAFVRLRRTALTIAQLGRKVDELERRYNAKFRMVFQAIRELMQPLAPPRKAIGFRSSGA